jgi:hypothetical protein
VTESISDAFASLLSSLDLDGVAQAATDQALIERVSTGAASWDDSRELVETLALLEIEAMTAYRSSLGSGEAATAARRQTEEVFALAGGCAQLIAEIRSRGVAVPTADDDALPAGLDLPFRVAVSALVSRRTSDVRLSLDSMVERGELVAAQAPGHEPTDLDWEGRLLADTFGAFVLLVRKQDGWLDIDTALEALDRLRDVQSDLQSDYLTNANESGTLGSSTARLVALFHLAQCVTLAGRYLATGEGSRQGLQTRLDRHRDNAHEAAQTVGVQGGATLAVLTDLLWAGCRELVANSIWSHVEGLGDQVSQFASLLASRGRDRPVLELWPSQQEALAGNVLDQYRRAVLVQMPTSAGKTLLAEFMIIQSRALSVSSTIAYVVPTRALVNQVTRDLRADLGPLGLSVEQAVPAYELDPSEQAMLSGSAGSSRDNTGEAKPSRAPRRRLGS